MAGPGSSGPTVMLHTPASPRVIFSAPPACQSAVRVTSAAFGARIRKVTVRSGWTSGETGVPVFTGCAGAAVAAARRQTRARGLMVAPPGGEGPRGGRADGPRGPHRGRNAGAKSVAPTEEGG